MKDKRGASPFRVSRESSDVDFPQAAIPVQYIYNYSTGTSDKTGLPVIEQQTNSVFSGYDQDPGLIKKWHSLSSLAKNGHTPHPTLGSLPRSKTFIAKVDKNREQLPPHTTSVDNIMAAVMYNGYHKKDHSLGKEDKLPVVELKPFISSTKKEWRPSRSWAWGEEPMFQQQNLQNLSASVDSLGYPDLHKLETTPRYIEGMCAKAFPTTGERKSLHPKVKDVADGTVIQREVSFVPKIEREKTTVEEIKNVAMYNQYPPYSFISRELTEVDIRRQQKIQVHGLKMDKGNGKQTSFYQKSWHSYQSKSAVEPSRQNEKLDVTNSNQHPGKENTYLDDRIYDCFDRATTLPSITVKAVSQNKKPKTSKDPGVRKKSARFGASPGYRLGVVNSLDVMSMCGKPLKIEQSLTNHLTSTLAHIKRTKDTTFVPMNNVAAEKVVNHKTEIGSSPTIGELLISVGRKSNGVTSPHSAPAFRSKSLKSTSDVRNLSRATTTYYDSGFEGSSDNRMSPTKSSHWSTKISQSKQKVTQGVVLKRTTRSDKSSNNGIDHSASLVPQNSKENMEVKPAKAARKSTRTPSTTEQNVDKTFDASSLDDSVELNEAPSKQQDDFRGSPMNVKECKSTPIKSPIICTTDKEQELTNENPANATPKADMVDNVPDSTVATKVNNMEDTGPPDTTVEGSPSASDQQAFQTDCPIKEDALVN